MESHGRGIYTGRSLYDLAKSSLGIGTVVPSFSIFSQLRGLTYWYRGEKDIMEHLQQDYRDTTQICS